MNLSIRHKLALALSLLSLAVCSGIYIGIRDDFNRGFLYFMNQVRFEGAQVMADFIEQELSPTSIIELAPTMEDWKEIEHLAMLNSGRIRPPPPPSQRQRNQATNSPPRDRTLFISPFSPVDLNGRAIYKEQQVDENWPRIALKGADGIVGYIAIKPFSRINSKAEQIFLERQHRYFFIITAIALLVSILVAWPLVFILLGPLKKLANTVNSIANRDYTANANITSNDELGYLSNNINLLTEKLGRHDKIQTEWLAQISHDLRTPITIILAEIEAIKDGVYPLDKNTIGSIETEIKRLDKQISDLHELSILKCGEVPIKKHSTDIAALVRSLAQETQTLRRQKSLDFLLFSDGIQIDVTHDTSSVLWSLDRDKIYHVLTNLMQNSIRYSDDPGHIRCRINAGKTLTLIWEDTKPGVNEGDLTKIFEPLFQCANNSNINIGSSGIGLSIVAAIVKLHGGTVTAENIPDEGLRIIMEIP